MKGMREIRTRIKAVKNTAQITRAMELVSSAKMKKAQNCALNSRIYAKEMAILFHTIMKKASFEEISHQFLEERQIKHRGIVIISQDKGLCGALNQNLFKIIMDLKDDVKFIVVGNKGVQFLSRNRSNIIAHFNSQDSVKFRQVQEISHFLIDAFNNHEIDTVEILFPWFKNTLVQKPVLKRLLPMINFNENFEDFYELSDIGTDELERLSSCDYLFEPNNETILNRLPLLFLKKSIYRILLEAKACEHSARMVAMKGATDNAESLTNNLQLEYNKARQNGITQEIVEISSGQSANKLH